MDPARALRISLAFLLAGFAAAALVWAMSGDGPRGDAVRLAALWFAPVAILGGAIGALVAARRVVAHFNRETPGRPDFFHGPGDGSDPEDLARCWSCGHETYKLSSSCPRCGATMQSRRWARRYGAMLALLGGGLAAGMYLLLKILAPTLRAAVDGRAGGSMRFDGTPLQATAIAALLGLVLAFGAAAFGYGTYQMVTGRRSRKVVQGIIGLAAAAFLLGLLLAR